MSSCTTATAKRRRRQARKSKQYKPHFAPTNAQKPTGKSVKKGK